MFSIPDNVYFPPHYRYILYFTLGKKEKHSDNVLGYMVKDTISSYTYMPNIDVITTHKLCKGTKHILSNILRRSGLIITINIRMNSKKIPIRYWRNLKPTILKNLNTQKTIYKRMSKLKIKEIVAANHLMTKSLLTQSLKHWFKGNL